MAVLLALVVCINFLAKPTEENIDKGVADTLNIDTFCVSSNILEIIEKHLIVP